MLETVRQSVAQERAYESVMREFGELVERDPTIQSRLDAVSDKDGLAELYVQIGSENGFHFTADQVRIVMQEQKQGSNWILPRCVQVIMRGL